MSYAPDHSPDSRRLSRLLQSRATAPVILAISLSLTAAAWYVARQAVQESAKDRFEFQTQELQGAIQARMNVYEQVLWGGTGLFNASVQVSREEWHSYVSALDISNNWPGIQGLGFAVPLEQEEVADHIAAIRAEGFPEFTITPAGAREEYSSIIYLEPFDARNQRAFGYDMWSNEMRRDAMTRARDTGLAATSGAITLVQETEDDVQRGFLTYLPVYRRGALPELESERRASLEGWVYAAFRMGDLMNQIQTSGTVDINFEIFDGREAVPDNLLFDSDEAFEGSQPSPDVDFHTTTFVEFQGREWMIVYSSGPNFLSESEANHPTLIALAALAFNGLLFLVIKTLGSLHRRQHQTNALLRTRTKELEEHAGRLEQSNTDLERYAHVASHDLQEPLRNIGSYASLLSRNYQAQLGEEGERWLEYISDSSRRLSGLVRDMLNYASIDAEHDPLAPVNLDHVLDNVLNDFAQVIAEENIEVARQPLPVVEGDVYQLGQLLQNLVGNGLKYRSETRQHRVSIGVSESDLSWRITISDNGIGIKPEYHERVFEIFRRVGSRSKYPGSGLGLSVCTKVIQRHGGTIGVNSEPDRGSEFWFTLPRVHVAEDDSSTVPNNELAKV